MKTLLALLRVIFHFIKKFRNGPAPSISKKAPDTSNSRKETHHAYPVYKGVNHVPFHPKRPSIPRTKKYSPLPMPASSRKPLHKSEPFRPTPKGLSSTKAAAGAIPSKLPSAKSSSFMKSNDKVGSSSHTCKNQWWLQYDEELSKILK